MISTATEAHQRVAEAGSGPHKPDHERQSGDEHDGGRQTTRRPGRPCAGLVPAALRAATMWTICESIVGTDLLRPHDEATGLVERACGRLRRRLGDRHRFACHHGFVDVAAAPPPARRPRGSSPRAHAKQIADLDVIDRCRFVGSVSPNPNCLLGARPSNALMAPDVFPRAAPAPGPAAPAP